jgi:hypothetical protein
MPVIGSLAGASSRAYGLQAGVKFQGGNQTTTDLKTLAGFMTTGDAANGTAGGTLTVNGLSLGSYDYAIKKGNQTISSFTNSDWFTTTEDTRSAFIAVNGDLTINAGQTLIPTNRKLFTCIFVRGNLTVNGSISMSSRGSNHSGTGNSGGAVTAREIKLILDGTYGGVTNPVIPAAGGAGVAVNSNGTAGANGGTGAGGGGVKSGTGGGGLGAAGTSFSGGSAGGSSWNAAAGSGIDNGGAGGNSGCGGSGGNAGGAGNPAGSPCNTGTAGSNGTGGVLIIFVTEFLIFNSNSILFKISILSSSSDFPT